MTRIRNFLGLLSILIIKVNCTSDSVINCITYGNILKNGFHYRYKYTGEAIASAVGTTDMVSGMKYDCEISVNSLEQCKFSMKVSKCELYEVTEPGNQPDYFAKHSSSDDFETTMKKYPITFWMSDGNIGDVEHANDEALWILNIKRAIVSSFSIRKSQIISDDWKLHTDVQGTCPRRLNRIGNDGNKLKTTKNLHFCRLPSRKYWELSPWSVFNNMSFIQNVINSTTECEYDLNNDGVSKISCRERHAILLESTLNTTNAVQTNIKKSVEFIDKTPAKSEDIDQTTYVKASIIYSYDDLPSKPSRLPTFETKAYDLMKNMVEITDKETRIMLIPIFTEFLAHIRSSDDLIPTIGGIKSCSYITPCSASQKERGITFLKDALVQCNNVVCLKAFKAMIDDIEPMYLNVALVTWAHGYVNDPVFIRETAEICKEKQTHTCWLSLGTMIGNYVSKLEKVSYRQFPDGIYSTVEYMVNKIGSGCGSDSESKDVIYGIIQALYNVGGKAFNISPSISSNLLKCIKNDGIDADVKVAAIQLRGIVAIDPITRGQLWSVVNNENLEPRIRIEAYSVSANQDGSKQNAQKILDSFSVMKSKQVKSFIASHLSKIISNDLRDSNRHTVFDPVLMDGATRPFGNKQLSDELMLLFEENQRYNGLLQEVKHYHGNYSQIKSSSDFTEFDSWRNYENSFGYLSEEKSMYHNDNLRPNFLSFNDTFEFLGHVVNYLESGVGIEGIGEPITRDNFGGKLQYVLQAVQQILSDGGPFSQINFEGMEGLSDTIVENLGKLHAQLSKLMKKNPHFLAYFKLIGKYISFVTLSDIKETYASYKSQLVSLPSMVPQLSQGLSKNFNRNIKVVEAYHQFPTIIGLPVNWTTDATLSLSLRTAIKLDMSHVETSIDFKPSGVLTFINNMIVVMPTITKAGIQSNTTGFTSTSWKFKLRMHSPDKVSLNLEAPNEAQELANFFRYNYIIRGNAVKMLPDYDIDRVTKVWCKEGTFKTITGFKACHQRSYADVTKLVKPWFLMAGWAKWRLALFKADRDLKSYTVILSKAKVGTDIELKIEAEAPGSYARRAVSSSLRIGDSVVFRTTVAELPDFLIKFEKSSAMTNSDKSNQISFEVKDANGKLYKISYKSHLLLQRVKTNVGKNVSPKLKYVSSVTADHVLNFILPHEKYGWNYKIQRNGPGLDTKMIFSYEKIEPHKSWLEPILPDLFWEIGKMKSWVLFKAKILPPVTHASQQVVESYFNLDIPRTDLEAHSLQTVSKTGNSIVVKLKKVEVESKEMKSFADFIYVAKYQGSNTGEKIILQNLNLTVPRHSIAFDALFKSLDKVSKSTFTLRYSKMIPKANNDWFHIGWWNKGTEDRFDHKSWSSSLDVVIEDIRQQWPIVSKVDNLSDLSSYGGHTFQQGTIDAGKWMKVVFTYPYGEGSNTISASGNFISDSMAAKGLSYYRDTRIHSSVHETTLKWQYYALWNAERTKIFGNIMHHNSIKNLNAQYNLNLENVYNPWNIQLFHSLTLPHLDYYGSVSSQARPKQHDMILTSESKSDLWDGLNSRIDQYFHFGSEGWESMNFSSSILIANTSVKWTDPWYRSYKKKIAILSKTEVIPSMELNIAFKGEESYEASLQFKDTGNTVKVHRVTKPNMKSTDYNVNYIENGVDQHMLWTHLQIVTKLAAAFNVTYDTSPMMSLYSKVYSKVKLFSSYYSQAANDPEHLLNLILSQFIGGKTVARFKNDAIQDMNYLGKAFAGNAYSFVKTWDVFYAPSFEIPVNAWHGLKKAFADLDISFRKTFTGWALYYFEVPSLITSSRFREALKSEIFTQITRRLIIPTKDGFMAMIIHPFHWPKLNEFPKLTPELKDFLSRKVIDKVTPSYPEYQTAIVYGDGEIYTLDSKSYNFNEYPVDGCIYLLAHDVVGGSFSLFKTFDSIVLAMQNKLYRIDRLNNVYINDQSDPTSLPMEIKSSIGNPATATIVGFQDIVEVNTSVGLHIVCDSANILCVIKLNQRYSGKTAGLLGNFDSEDYNDFMTSTGAQSTDIYSFVASYEVSGKKGCKDTNLMKTKARNCQTINHQNNLKCQSLFDYESLVSKNYYGFKKVFPGPFLQACNRQAKCEQFTSCNLQVGYVAACYNRGIKINGCGQCEGSYDVEKRWNQGMAKKVQVVLLIDNYYEVFNQQNNVNGLKVLLEKIDSNFAIKGYDSRSYALVSFGKSEFSTWTDPQIRITSNEIWQSLTTMTRKTIQTVEFDAQERYSPEKALIFAIDNLHFKLDASKVFVMLTLDDTMAASSVDTTLKKLKSADVSLYVIADFPSVYKEKHIYGVRGDGYVFPHPPEAKKLGKEVLFVSPPTSPLAKLTSALHSAIFHRKYLVENRQSEYFSELAEEMVTKVFKEVQKQKTCTCVQDFMWNVRSKCNFS